MSRKNETKFGLEEKSANNSAEAEKGEEQLKLSQRMGKVRNQSLMRIAESDHRFAVN